MGTSEKLWKPSETTMVTMQKEAVTPIEVRDVIAECFVIAHGDAEQVGFILRAQAAKASMDWERPTRAGLERLIPRLVEVALTFRDRDVILKNRNKVMALLHKCGE